MSLCAKCSSYKVCTECDSGKILRNDFAGCVSSCSEDTSTGLGTLKVPSYHPTAELKQCVSNCSATNFLWALAETGDSCVLASSCTAIL